MSNNKTANINESSILLTVVAYYAFTLIIVGTALNLLTFVILCRKKFRNMKERPTLYYMRAVVIVDILMLYGWNFEHYLSIVYGFAFRNYTIVSCKLFMFLNYLTHHTSAWLRVFICLDRYLSLSRLHRTWFGRPKSVLIIIACVISFFTLFNLHLIIFGCFYETNGSLNINARFYTIYPMWDFVKLAIYNCLPFLFMVMFNSGVIYHLFHLSRVTTIQNSRIHHRSISITAIVTTFLFLIMTIPVTIAFGFFLNTAGDLVLYTMDSMLYTYHISSFPLYMITFHEFRQEFIKMVTCNNNDRRIGPQATVSTHKLSRT
jgi:hypothetical protein